MAEARHRHNFPYLCQPGFTTYKFRTGSLVIKVRTRKGSLHARVLAEKKLSNPTAKKTLTLEEKS